MTHDERRVALVTGGGNGIGLAAVERFLAEGARVMALDRDRDALDALEADHSADELVVATCDVTRSQDIADAVNECLDRWDRLDVTYANAGVTAVEPIAEITDSAWARVLDTNLGGVFFTIRESARAMKPGSSIVVTASTNAFWVESGLAHYNASKGGTVALVRTAALELAQYGIRVNAVAPGLIRTRLTNFITEDESNSGQYLSQIPLQRFGTPTDVVDAVAFLTSPGASWITGATLVIDGGQTLGAPLPQSTAAGLVGRSTPGRGAAHDAENAAPPTDFWAADKERSQ
ncbi:MAG: SDR family oxidoreductase [Acidimicrobiia bacterium]|nr:MAG: SDR family oxidoreductase [Acidimicrobiia bacterium]